MIMMFVTMCLAIVGGLVRSYLSIHNHSGPARRDYSTSSSSSLTCEGQAADIGFIIGCQLFQKAVEVVSWLCQEVTRLLVHNVLYYSSATHSHVDIVSELRERWCHALYITKILGCNPLFCRDLSSSGDCKRLCRSCSGEISTTQERALETPDFGLELIDLVVFLVL